MSEVEDGALARLRALARLAGLKVAPSREAAVAELLDEWVIAADELSRKMSEAQYQSLMPITVLTHAGDGGEAES